jgi:hypothetical protein
MDKPFSLGLARRRIEDAILAKARQVDSLQPDGRWLDNENFWDFIYAWHDLHVYYEQHCEDTTLSADLLRLYVDYAYQLRALSADNRIKLWRRERAESALLELNYQVDGVIHQVERNAAKKD